MSELERQLGRLVRVGTVTDLDRDRRMARVKFHSEGFTSGWLYVLQHYETQVRVAPDKGQGHSVARAGEHSHPGSTGYMAAGLNLTQDGGHVHSVEETEEHDHPGTVTTWWMPRIDESVLCLYLPVFNGDGFILGGIGNGRGGAGRDRI